MLQLGKGELPHHDHGRAEWWRPLVESALEPVGAALVDLADLRPGRRVLDVAPRIGKPALGDVRGVATEEELQDLPSASFDAAVCRFGLMFLRDLSATLERVLDLLVPGGRLAVAVWGPPGRCPALTLPLATMRQYMDPPSVAPGTAGLFGLGAEGVIEDELNLAGFTDVRSRRLVEMFEWSSVDQFTSFHQAVAVHMHGIADAQPAWADDETRHALVESVRAWVDADGGLCLDAEVVVAVGQRAANGSRRQPSNDREEAQ